MQPRLQIEGVRELNRLLKQVGGKELQKELGQVHKRIGEMVISRLGGAATGVGTGAGSTIRPSAVTREVVLRVGGSHRSKRVQQWGKRPIMPHPHRPHLIGAANEIQDQIEEAYLSGVDAIVRRVGLG